MANWKPTASRQISERIVVTGELVLDTPAHFGSGEQNGTELILLVDALENKPLLPGASLAGALRHYLLTREFGYRLREDDIKSSIALELFGEALSDNAHRPESRVIVDDAIGEEGHRDSRDGVKIDGTTRTADEGMLFSTQVWQPGTRFPLRFELLIFQDSDEDKKDKKREKWEDAKKTAQMKQAFAAALLALEKSEIPMGGRKNRGYGRMHVENWHVSYYNLANPEHLLKQLKRTELEDTAQEFFAQAKDFRTDKREYIRIESTYQLCDSILIRSQSDDAHKAHLTSNGKAVLSGTSIAGALRARALKIANTIAPSEEKAIKLIDDFFGIHGSEEVDSSDLTASRLIVEEHEIKGGEFNYLQNRVKLDRFTGGSFETALFEQQPLFADGDTVVTINMELRFPAISKKHKDDDTKQREKVEAEAGLLLLLLKDLWTEDLPLGGESSVGRGRLSGVEAKILLKSTDNNHPEEVHIGSSGLPDTGHRAKLQYYVDALWKEMEA